MRRSPKMKEQNGYHDYDVVFAVTQWILHRFKQTKIVSILEFNNLYKYYNRFNWYCLIKFWQQKMCCDEWMTLSQKKGVQKRMSHGLYFKYLPSCYIYRKTRRSHEYDDINGEGLYHKTSELLTPKVSRFNHNPPW